MSYTYPTVEIAKVPGHRITEPAIQKLFEAIRIRAEREKSFNRDSLTDNNRKEYLDSITDELKIRSQEFKYQIYEMGKLLCEAKTILQHGQFQPWLDNNFDLGYRTAYNFMKVYRACMGHPEVVKYFNPSCLYVLTSPSFPKDLRQALFIGAKGPVDIKKKDLVKLALEFKNGLIKTTNQEVQNILKKQRDISIWEKYKIELEALNVLIANRLERIEKLSTIHSVNPLIEKDNEQEQLNREDLVLKIENQIKSYITEINLLMLEVGEKCK